MFDESGYSGARFIDRVMTGKIELAPIYIEQFQDSTDVGEIIQDTTETGELIQNGV